MAQNTAAKSNNLPKIILGTLQHCDQLIVETCNSTYVFLWNTLHSSRLIRCSNEHIDLGNVYLLGSYPGEPGFEASGQLCIGETMLYATSLYSPEPDCEVQAVWTSPIRELRYHRPDITPARPIPGLLQPQSKFSQGQLETPPTIWTEHKFEGSPVLWTPRAPKIPRSSVSSSLAHLGSLDD